MKQQNFLPKVA